MKKLMLDLANLQVESFETFASEQARRGTVRANAGCVTWSCAGTCGAQPASDVEKNGDYAGTFACTNNGACCV
jgi:hypothetical protein